MKKLILILSVILLASCSSNDDSGDVNNDQFEDIVNILPQGTWKVSLFTEDGADHTMDFESFVFTFNTDNSATATNDLFTENGTWSYQNSSSGSSSDDEKLILQFSNTTPFDGISEDYAILSASSSKVELKHVSGGNGGTDLLTFTKL